MILKKFNEFINESIMKKHYKERMKERLDPNNFSLEVEGINPAKIDNIKANVLSLIQNNINILKEEKYYPKDKTVRVIKTANVIIKKENKELNVKIKVKFKNKKGVEIIMKSKTFYSICIDNNLITFLPVEDNKSDEALYAQMKNHLIMNNFDNLPIVILNYELNSNVTIYLDENDNIIEKEYTHNTGDIIKQKTISIGMNIHHIGLIVNPDADGLETIKDENGKAIRDFKNAKVVDIINSKGISIKKGSKDDVSKGVKILFDDRTPKTFRPGDKIKIDNKIIVIDNIMLDNRTDNPVIFKFK